MPVSRYLTRRGSTTRSRSGGFTGTRGVPSRRETEYSRVQTARANAMADYYRRQQASQTEALRRAREAQFRRAKRLPTPARRATNNYVIPQPYASRVGVAPSKRGAAGNFAVPEPYKSRIGTAPARAPVTGGGTVGGGGGYGGGGGGSYGSGSSSTSGGHVHGPGESGRPPGTEVDDIDAARAKALKDAIAAIAAQYNMNVEEFGIQMGDLSNFFRIQNRALELDEKTKKRQAIEDAVRRGIGRSSIYAQNAADIIQQAADAEAQLTQEYGTKETVGRQGSRARKIDSALKLLKQQKKASEQQAKVQSEKGELDLETLLALIGTGVSGTNFAGG